MGIHICNLQPDFRTNKDYKFEKIKDHSVKVKPYVNLIDEMNPIENQGNLGACQSFASGSIVEHIKGNPFSSSKLFTYYNVRDIEGTINEDSGGTLKDTCDAIRKYGICNKNLWEYDITKYQQKPSQEAYDSAKSDEIFSYYRANNIDDLIQSLSQGYIPLIGINIYESFESQKCMDTGIIPQRAGGKLGGHALALPYYNLNQEPTCKALSFITSIFIKRSIGDVIIRNSWGTDVGLPSNRGYFKTSIENLEDLLMDAWIITK